ncbi:hypothetical protein G7061_08735 [Erysipelothrix sp. HDW6B]|uniref:hypothetical protein n=1 Tax=Erysipelothrix TaxID=1647 RepID=UPI00135BAB57|nr:MULTISPECIES: hypothetical protein [Erysipelothrix]QIK86694.1 hypothetical protein G7061_08735 [Erysipelothrix sp. HDW6B]
MEPFDLAIIDKAAERLFEIETLLQKPAYRLNAITYTVSSQHVKAKNIIKILKVEVETLMPLLEAVENEFERCHYANALTYQYDASYRILQRFDATTINHTKRQIYKAVYGIEAVFARLYRILTMIEQDIVVNHTA